MNSAKVQELVEEYKGTSDRVQRNKLIQSLLGQYNKIIHNLSRGVALDDLDEFHSLVRYEMVICLHRYNLDKKATFVTYFYGYLRAAVRKYFGKSLCQAATYKDTYGPDDTKVLDFGLDKEHILNSRMSAVYNILCTRRQKIQKKDLDLLYTMRSYFND